MLDKKTGTNLLQWPVEEMESLRLNSKEFNNVEVKPGSVVPLDVGTATQVRIVSLVKFVSKFFHNKGTFVVVKQRISLIS